jgi:hypothetical protein
MCRLGRTWRPNPLTDTDGFLYHDRREKGICTADIVRELKRTNPGVWGCVQAREVWSSEEESNIRSDELCREEVRVAGPQVGGVQGM